MIFKCAVPAIIDDSILSLAEDFENADLQSIASLLFIKVAIFLSGSSRAGVVLN